MNNSRGNDEYNILINKGVHLRSFTDDDLKLLNDLITFNYRYQEAFFNNEIDNDILEMIDGIIDEKLKSISPDLAFKFLNRIWTIYGNVNSTLDANILNNVEIDLVIHRLSILLLDRATDDDTLFYKFINDSSNGLHNYLIYNFYHSFYDTGLKANKMLILDHVELFIALLNESTEIKQDLTNEITNIYLFLYKDLYNEVLKNNLTKNSAIILSQRFNGYERCIMNYHTDIREENFSIQFVFEAMVMLNIKDDIINELYLEYLKIGKIYLDSLLMLLKDFEKDKVLSYYQENKKTVDTRECTKALSYVNKSIEETKKK